MNDERLTDMKALARRAVACKRWRWMPGMSWVVYRLAPLEPVSGRVADTRPRDSGDVRPHALPDLSDHATVGCLLALVREAWDDEWLACKGDYSPHGSTWIVYSGKPHGRGFLLRVAGTRYPTEAAALVAALEAAP